MKVSDLTEAQKNLLLYLGSTADGKVLDSEDRKVWGELLSLGAIHKRGDGNFDLTAEGERLYDKHGGK
jgi:hypothetical protein